MAQLDLSLAVVREMSGDPAGAAAAYGQLAGDVRLSLRDRHRAGLWVGTSLDRQGLHEAAVPLMRAAIQGFDGLGEPEDWGTAHQKPALVHRGAGDIGEAARMIEVASQAATYGMSHQPRAVERIRGSLERGGAAVQFR
ncbi:hypothetical protein ACFC60_26180 [Kitasatospora purpeofusca]|uniref:hypothetical protein n=1 Tax=Kitasatospora purpeofusca TaxID=67352 RepID=UPI0035E2ECDD